MFKRVLPWVILLVLVGGGTGVLGGILGRIFFPAKPPPPPAALPIEAVPEVEIDQESLDKIAVLESTVEGLEIRNGQLVLADGRKAAVIRRLTIETEAAPPPAEELPAVKEILKVVCEEHVVPVYKTFADLFEFRGIPQDGPDEETYGWTGEIGCLMAAPARPGREQFWATVHKRKLRLSNTSILTTETPPPPTPFKRWTVGIHYALVTDGFSFVSAGNDYSSPISLSFESNRFRGYWGIRLFPLKSITPEFTIWGETGAAGFGVGADF